MIKAIIFDVDGVLVDSREANIYLFQKLLKKAGYPPASREEILSCFHLPLWQSLEKLTGSKDQTEIKRVWDMYTDASLRQSSLFIFPEKLEQILENLHKTYRLAIVTGRTRFGMENVFSVKDIRRLFEVIVTFDDYKNPKPHPEPLLVALKSLALSADEAIYVGDSETDIEATRAAGMKSIFLSNRAHPDATVVIAEFDELIRAIEKIINL